MKEHGLTHRECERPVVEREGDRERPSLRIEDSSNADQASRRHSVRVTRDLDLLCDRATRARRFRLWNLPHQVNLRGVDDPEQHATCADVCASRGITLGDDAADWGADDEQPIRV
jgi:hypothetical protein